MYWGAQALRVLALVLVVGVLVAGAWLSTWACRIKGGVMGGSTSSESGSHRNGRYFQWDRAGRDGVSAIILALVLTTLAKVDTIQTAVNQGRVNDAGRDGKITAVEQRLTDHIMSTSPIMAEVQVKLGELGERIAVVEDRSNERRRQQQRLGAR